MADVVGLEIIRDDVGNPITLGAHRGNSAALNVRNPKPGHGYYYERAKAGNVLTRRNKGWEVVRDGDPEDWGAQLPFGVSAALDTTRAYGDVLLMRAPDSTIRAEQQELGERARHAREGPERDFLAKNAGVSAALGTYAPDAETYFRARGHAVVVTSEDD